MVSIGWLLREQCKMNWTVIHSAEARFPLCVLHFPNRHSETKISQNVCVSMSGNSFVEIISLATIKFVRQRWRDQSIGHSHAQHSNRKFNYAYMHMRDRSESGPLCAYVVYKQQYKYPRGYGSGWKITTTKITCGHVMRYNILLAGFMCVRFWWPGALFVCLPACGQHSSKVMNELGWNFMEAS